MILKGKNVMVTGANRGIGKAVVEVCAEQGANVWACSRKAPEEMREMCEALSERHRVWVEPVSFDMTDEAAMAEAVKKIHKEKRPIDALVNVAGVIPETKSFHMAKPEEMQRVFQVNFFSVMALTKLVSRCMLRNKSGSIVNVASIAALDGEPAQMEYVSSKAALVGATKKLASELSSYHIRVNAVAPGLVETDMMEAMQTEMKERMIQNIWMKRLAQPREIAGVIAFLASDLSSYMTGQILRADGGM